LTVCLLGSLRKNFRRDLHKFSGKVVGNGPMNKRLNFSGDPDHRPDTWFVFLGFVTIGRHGKWLTDTNLLLILIRQMATLVRRALAEVCGVPVLLVYNQIILQ